MKTIVHVNQAVIRRNHKTGERESPLTVKTYKENRRAKEVIIHGPCRVVYRPDRPLSCGARVWIEVTDAEVEIVGEENCLDTGASPAYNKPPTAGDRRRSNAGKEATSCLGKNSLC